MVVFHSIYNRLFKTSLSSNAFEKELGVVLKIAINNKFPNFLKEKFYSKHLTKLKFSFNTTYFVEKVMIWLSLMFDGQVPVRLSKLFSSLGLNIACSTADSFPVFSVLSGIYNFFVQ